MTKEEDIQSAIVRFYESLYKNAEWMPRLDGLHFPSIDETDRGWLEREFDREDFLEVIRHQGLMSLLWLFSNSAGILWRKMFWHFLMRYFLIVVLGSLLVLHLFP